eukprot:6492397-Amphidinium_carterae.4
MFVDGVDCLFVLKEGTIQRRIEEVDGPVYHLRLVGCRDRNIKERFEQANRLIPWFAVIQDHRRLDLTGL